MRKLLLANAAALAMAVAGPVLAADMPLKAETPFAARFSWTGCYVGGHVGGGFGRKDITDPVQLVQDSFLGAGSTVDVTTVSPSPTGVVIGGQIGCDYQFAPSWVVGIEGAASGSTMRNTRTVGLPLSPDTALVKANTDFLPSLTVRLGYAIDNVLLYAKGASRSPEINTMSPVHSAVPRLPLRGWTIAWGGPSVAAWTGLSRIIGPPSSNTTTINSDMATS